MGSPLSPVIANLYLESLEETAIGSAPLKPNLRPISSLHTLISSVWPIVSRHFFIALIKSTI